VIIRAVIFDLGGVRAFCDLSFFLHHHSPPLHA